MGIYTVNILVLRNLKDKKWKVFGKFLRLMFYLTETGIQFISG